jgi:hypothetical protein
MLHLCSGKKTRENGTKRAEDKASRGVKRLENITVSFVLISHKNLK